MPEKPGIMGDQGVVPGGGMSAAAVSALPSGVVTFLFTDIGGSTRLFQRLGERWPPLLAQHDAIVLTAVGRYDGVVVSREGDSFFAVFTTAADAVRAVAEVQERLRAHPWPAGAEIRVRAGIHTGYAVPHEDNYVALAVHQAARVVGAAHPGQTLLTEPTMAALGPLPASLTLESLGAHRLRDFDVPQNLFELRSPAITEQFPDLPGAWRGLNNLPVPRTSFIGRDNDVTQIRSLLRRTRLLTVVGPGGSGKTRVAMQVAAAVLDGSGDGVWFVELAPVQDAAQVPGAVLRALGIAEQRDRTVTDTLVEALRSRRMLVVLDNCEHLVDACAALVDTVLTHCPQVVVLATSRQPLDVDGEHLYRLPPLGLPPAGLPVSTGEAEAFEAVRLFAERAQAHQPVFAVDEANVEVVVDICRRLEGIPLAIELAAARLRSLSVDAIATRLDDQLTLLVGNHRSATARQQTVRALVDWSYDLLDDAEQRLLRRLSVFTGGCRLDAAFAVAADPDETEIDVLDRLGSLVDKSLVQAEVNAGEVRYTLLETVRQYADRKLRENDATDLDQLRLRHRDHYLDFAELAKRDLNTRDQRRWLARLDAEDGNLRAALQHTLADPAGVPIAFRFVAALASYWVMRGRAAEGLQWADRALAFAVSDPPTSDHAAALAAVAALLMRCGDFNRAGELLDEALRIAREVGDRRRAAVALNDLAWLSNRRGDLEAARTFAEEALSLAETEAETHLAARIYSTLGDLAERSGDLASGRRYFEAARRRFDVVGDVVSSAKTLNNLGLIDLALGDRVAARQALEECLATFSELQEAASLPTVLSNLGLIAVEDAEYERAYELFLRGLRLGQRARDKELMVYTTLGLALATAGLGDTTRAATLHGICDALSADLGMSLDPLEGRLQERSKAELRELLRAEWQATYDAGLTMDTDEAVGYALADLATAATPV